MDIKLFKVFMSPDVLSPLNEILMSGQLTQGSKVENFERMLQQYLNNPLALTLNSATSGLTLAMRLLKEKSDTMDWPGFDESTDVVLTPALTCFATTAAILANNVNIRWLDSDLTTANISLEDVRSKLNANTKVIYLVHWGGNPVDLEELDKICEEHKAKYGYKPFIVEDCAHAFGAEYNGEKIGSFKLNKNNHICVFSFQAIKHLTTGDGSLITLPTEELYERCKLLRWFGIDRNKRNVKGKDFRLENDIIEWGYKFHMNDVNATIGIYNLPHIPDLLKKNRANALYFNEELKYLDGIQIMESKQQGDSAYWLYTIRVLNGKKKEFMERMKDAGIMTSQVHNRNDINSVVREYQEPLRNLDILEKELVCIPVGWWLTSEEKKHIITNIIEILSV